MTTKNSVMYEKKEKCKEKYIIIDYVPNQSKMKRMYSKKMHNFEFQFISISEDTMIEFQLVTANVLLKSE